MRIAAVLSRWPFPPIAGRERVLLQHLHQLQQVGELVLFGPEPAGERPEWLKDTTFITIPKSSTIRALVRAFAKRLTFQEAYYSSSEGSRILEQEHARHAFDLIYVDMIRMAGTVTRLQCFRDDRPRIVIDFDDRLSRRYEQMLQLASPNLLGARANDFPMFVQWFAKRLGRVFLALESARMRRREVYWGRNCDFRFFSASTEAREFGEELAISACGSAPLLPAEHPPILENTDTVPRLLFIGNIKNSQGWETFQLILQAMEKRLAAGLDVPDVHVFGVHGDPVLPQPLRHKVILHGFVDTLASIAKQPGILLAPITFGTGIKTKVFDALAIGIPVVTTYRGIEGLEAVPGRELDVVEEAGDVLAAAINLSQDSARFLAMRTAGLAYVADKHSSARAVQSYQLMLGL